MKFAYTLLAVIISAALVGCGEHKESGNSSIAAPSNSSIAAPSNSSIAAPSNSSIAGTIDGFKEFKFGAKPSELAKVGKFTFLTDTTEGVTFSVGLEKISSVLDAHFDEQVKYLKLNRPDDDELKDLTSKTEKFKQLIARNNLDEMMIAMKSPEIVGTHLATDFSTSKFQFDSTFMGTPVLGSNVIFDDKKGTAKAYLFSQLIKKEDASKVTEILKSLDDKYHLSKGEPITEVTDGNQQREFANGQIIVNVGRFQNAFVNGYKLDFGYIDLDVANQRKNEANKSKNDL